jgi:hypothetical protein
MSIPGCQRPASSPKGEVTVPCAGHADQSGAGCVGIGALESASVTSKRASKSRGRLAGRVRWADDHDQPALVRPARKRVDGHAAELRS